MKSIAYDERDSLNTSKEGGQPRRKAEVSPSIGPFKSRVNSAAENTVHSFMVTGETTHHAFISKKPSGLPHSKEVLQNVYLQDIEDGGEERKVYLKRRSQQHLSATSITRLLMPGRREDPHRTKSTHQLFSHHAVVKEEPHLEAILSSRKPKRKSIV